MFGVWKSHLVDGDGASVLVTGGQHTMPKGAASGLRGALPAALGGGIEGQLARCCC